MSHLPLDARAILEYLNELGYRNISAEHLKEFLKDLRKLIKYDERFGLKTNEQDYFTSLYQRTTASYRAKVDKEIAEKQTQQPFRSLKSTSAAGSGRSGSGRSSATQSEGEYTSTTTETRSTRFRNQPSATTAVDSLGNNLLRGLMISAKNPTRQRKDNALDSTSRATYSASTKHSQPVHKRDKENMPEWLTGQGDVAAAAIGRKRPQERERQVAGSTQRSERGSEGVTGSVMISRRFRSAHNKSKKPVQDPVALYHYYQREWKHFREQIPGQSSHADLRWKIRQKLLDPQ